MRIFYTDGSCSPNPGPGGFAVIENGKPVALGYHKESTNIRMEGHALAASMRLAARETCEIHTDSEFWVNVITKWAPGWEAKGWKKSSRGEIQNLDLVKELYNLHKNSKSKLVWVKAHVGHNGNELADEWANRARTDKLSK
jgi:ribonuclease HI